jgi:hypothetical protein
MEKKSLVIDKFIETLESKLDLVENYLHSRIDLLDNLYFGDYDVNFLPSNLPKPFKGIREPDYQSGIILECESDSGLKDIDLFLDDSKNAVEDLVIGFISYYSEPTTETPNALSADTKSFKLRSAKIVLQIKRIQKLMETEATVHAAVSLNKVLRG